VDVPAVLRGAPEVVGVHAGEETFATGGRNNAEPFGRPAGFEAVLAAQFDGEMILIVGICSRCRHKSCGNGKRRDAGQQMPADVLLLSIWNEFAHKVPLFKEPGKINSLECRSSD